MRRSTATGWLSTAGQLRLTPAGYGIAQAKSIPERLKRFKRHLNPEKTAMQVSVQARLGSPGTVKLIGDLA